MTFLLSMLLSTATYGAGEGWFTNIDKATAKAKEEGKTLLLEFHGSDWCPPCIQLNKEVFASDDFKAFAEDKLIAVDLDFPRKKEQSAEQKSHNKELASKYGVRGFPTVILISPDGSVKNKSVGYSDKDEFWQFLKDNS